LLEAACPGPTWPRPAPPRRPRFDYLARDSRATGVAISLDYRRIMHYSRIAPGTGQVVFKWSEYENLYRGIFQERATMHSKVYTHRCHGARGAPPQGGGGAHWGWPRRGA
jgi:hypothetical protein